MNEVTDVHVLVIVYPLNYVTALYDSLGKLLHTKNYIVYYILNSSRKINTPHEDLVQD